VSFVVPLIIFTALGALAIFAALKTVEVEERGWLRVVLFAAFVLRIVAAAIFEIFPNLRVFHEDASGYEHTGMVLALSWQGKYEPIEISGQNIGYQIFCGVICYLFGVYRFNVPLANCLIGSLTVFLIYQLSRKFVHIRVARMAAGLVAFTPSMILWSGMALKDTVMTFLIVLALSSCVSLKQRIRPLPIIGIVLALAAIQPMRFYMAYFVGFAVVATLAIERGSRLVAGVYKQVALVGLLVAVIMLTGTSGRLVQDSETFDLARVSSFRRGMAHSAQSGFSHDVDLSTPEKALAFLPIGLATLLFSPFPWQVVSLRPLLAAPETYAWWLLFPATVRGILFVARRRFAEASPLFVFMVTLSCGYSLTHGNLGSGFRQRAQVFVFFFVFTAIGWYLKKCRRLGIDEDLLLRRDSSSGAGTGA